MAIIGPVKKSKQFGNKQKSIGLQSMCNVLDDN